MLRLNRLAIVTKLQRVSIKSPCGEIVHDPTLPTVMETNMEDCLLCSQRLVAGSRKLLHILLESGNTELLRN